MITCNYKCNDDYENAFHHSNDNGDNSIGNNNNKNNQNNSSYSFFSHLLID